MRPPYLSLGALSGVSQIIRGIVATPEAMVAPRQGKWWNEVEGKWTKTVLPDDFTKYVEGKPEDDSDLLGDIQEEVEASAMLSTEEVKETYYYDILEVGPQAEPSAIKRRYYVLARKYHPDKVDKDDKESGDKFKDIAEAYQVLSDPDLRKKYDADGRDGLSADKTSVANDMPKIDPSILFAFLFGSDKFTGYIGRLATATSAMVGDSPKVTIETARIIQHRRVTRLAVTLAENLEKWVSEDYDYCKTLWETEASDLSTASYGSQLVHLIGKVCVDWCYRCMLLMNQPLTLLLKHHRFTISPLFNSLVPPSLALACHPLASGVRTKRQRWTVGPTRTTTKWRLFVRV